MNSEIKIPTILGLAVLTIGLGTGVYLLTQNQNLKSKAGISSIPKNVGVANIGSRSASVYWQTDSSSSGFVKAGTTPVLDLTFRDDRDPEAPKPHQMHFVTLTSLSPNTTYYYKISSGPSLFPQKEPLKFTTSPDLPLADYNPVIGTVVDSIKQPAKEAIITLQIPGAQPLAAITKVAGSFVIPLTELKEASLVSGFPLSSQGVMAEFKVANGQSVSSDTVTVYSSGTQIPPITIGRVTPTTTNPQPTATTSAQTKQFDLSGDGKVDNLDISIVLKNFGKNPKQKEADFNKDEVVDQKDLQLIRDAMSGQ